VGRSRTVAFLKGPVGCSFARIAGRFPPMTPLTEFRSSRRIRERRLTKYIGHLARKSPAAGVGRGRVETLILRDHTVSARSEALESGYRAVRDGRT
jgi:hypothetical protein